MEKLLDTLCSDWHFDIDNLEHLIVTIDSEKYRKKIFSDYRGNYITHNGNKYYFVFPECK